MLASAEIVGFLVAFGVGIWLWHQNRHHTIGLVIRLGYAILITALLVAATGTPLFLYRTNRLQLSGAAVSAFHLVHHYAGHVFISVFVLYWPLLMIVSVARPATGMRRLILGIACVLCAYLFLFLSFTGYLLPPNLPRELSPLDAMHALRFFVLHVFVVPPLAALSLVSILWRHSRASTTG